MCGVIPPLPEYTFEVWCSVKKHRDNITFSSDSDSEVLMHIPEQGMDGRTNVAVNGVPKKDISFFEL
jgi:hypothetical protein